MPGSATHRKKGRPVLGAIGGLLMGLGVAILLQQFAIYPLSIATAVALPLGLLLVGLVLGLLPRGPKPAAASPAPAPPPPTPGIPNTGYGPVGGAS